MPGKLNTGLKNTYKSVLPSVSLVYNAAVYGGGTVSGGNLMDEITPNGQNIPHLGGGLFLGGIPIQSGAKALTKETIRENVKKAGKKLKLIMSIVEPKEVKKGGLYSAVATPVEPQEWDQEEVFGLTMRDFEADADVAGGIRGLRKMKEVLDSGGAVYVHCKAGKARSAMVCFAYLVAVCGMEEDAAIKLLKSQRKQVSLSPGKLHTARTIINAYKLTEKLEQDVGKDINITTTIDKHIATPIPIAGKPIAENKESKLGEGERNLLLELRNYRTFSLGRANLIKHMEGSLNALKEYQKEVNKSSVFNKMVEPKRSKRITKIIESIATNDVSSNHLFLNDLFYKGRSDAISSPLGDLIESKPAKNAKDAEKDLQKRKQIEQDLRVSALEFICNDLKCTPEDIRDIGGYDIDDTVIALVTPKLKFKSAAETAEETSLDSRSSISSSHENKGAESDNDDDVAALQKVLNNSIAKTKRKEEDFAEVASLFNNNVDKIISETLKQDQMEEISETFAILSEKAAIHAYNEYQILKASLISLDAAYKALQKGELKFSQILMNEIEFLNDKIESTQNRIETFTQHIDQLLGFMDGVELAGPKGHKSFAFPFAHDKKLRVSLEDTLRSMKDATLVKEESKDKDYKPNNGSLVKEEFANKELKEKVGYAKRSPKNAMTNLGNSSKFLLQKIQRVERVTRPKRKAAEQAFLGEVSALKIHTAEADQPLPTFSPKAATPSSKTGRDSTDMGIAGTVVLHAGKSGLPLPTSSPKAKSATTPKSKTDTEQGHD